MVIYRIDLTTAYITFSGIIISICKTNLSKNFLQTFIFLMKKKCNSTLKYLFHLFLNIIKWILYVLIYNSFRRQRINGWLKKLSIYQNYFYLKSSYQYMVKFCEPEKIKSSKTILSSMLYWMNYQSISIRETNWYHSKSELEDRRNRLFICTCMYLKILWIMLRTK